MRKGDFSDGPVVKNLPGNAGDARDVDRCVDLEDRGLMTEAGRQAFEKAFEYEIVPPDSEMIQQIKEENKLRRPWMYK